MTTFLKAQYNALILTQENLKLKKRTLELEVFHLEQRSCSIPATVSINININGECKHDSSCNLYHGHVKKVVIS